MSERNERGEGRLGTFVWLIIFGAMCLAGYNVLPTYIGHYNLADKCNEIARSSLSVNDERIVELCWKAAVENKLDRYLTKKDFKVKTEGHNRRINAAYEVTLEVLPGWKKTFQFTIEADQPIV